MYKKYKYYDIAFKEAAVKYYIEHKNMGTRLCAEFFSIDKSSLLKWYREYKN